MNVTKIHELYPAPSGWKAVYQEKGEPLLLTVLYFAKAQITVPHVLANVDMESLVPMVVNSLGFNADRLVHAPFLPGFVGLMSPEEELQPWKAACKKAYESGK